jgi:UDP-glucose 4-epimerase
MKVAVTGGSGFIGSRLVRRLVKEGYDVVNLDIMDYPFKDVKVETRKTDITKLDEVKNSLKDVELVYHLAGPVLDTVRKDPYKSTTLSTIGTLNVLEACRQNKIQKVIAASTFYVYDGLSPKFIVNEESQLDILKMELFGALKLKAESLIREYSRKYGIDYVILRFGSAFGGGNCTNVITTFIDLARKGEPIEIWGPGKRKNQYTYVEDIADGCFKAMSKANETFNLIHPEQTSTGDLGRLLQKKYDFRIFFNTIQKEGADMPYMSPRKAMEELHWKPMTLEEAVNKTVEEMFGNIDVTKCEEKCSIPENKIIGPAKEEDTLQWLQRKLQKV